MKYIITAWNYTEEHKKQEQFLNNNYNEKNLINNHSNGNDRYWLSQESGTDIRHQS